MTASRTTRRASRRPARSRKTAAPVAAAKIKAAARLAPPTPQLVLFRLCKSGWAVIAEKVPNASGTRFVCPFCPLSHRVPGPVRGFRKVRRAQWVKLRRVHE